MTEQALQFSVTNGDIGVVFSCPNHGKRIWETVRNLRIDRTNPLSEEQLTARFASADPNVVFHFDGTRFMGETRREAVFFENTDYPLFARASVHSGKQVKNLRMALSAHRVEDCELKNSISNVGGMLIGTLNFKNQVGLVDFEFSYTIDGREKKMAFTSEVLSFKMNYRTDMKAIIADKSINGLDVPPVDAINQMHRYRDAIYYTENSNEQLKREVIGGYVLYPGNLTQDDLDRSYYKRSIDRIGIGAFPLKPAPLLVDEEGNAYLDPTSSENELRQQIEQWLKDDNARQTLLQQAIPQRGLKYQIEDGRCDVVLVNYANEQHRTPFIEKKLCYLRTGDANGSVRLPALGQEPKFLLLHNGRSLFELFELEQNGAKIYSKQQLIAKGFSPSEDGFYLCYSIKTNSPIATNLPRFKELLQKGKLRYTPQLIMVENILKATWDRDMGTGQCPHQ